MTQRRKSANNLWRLGLRLAVVTVVLALAATAFGVWINSNAGKTWLKEKVEALLSTPEQAVSIGRLSGDIFSEIEINNVGVADRQGMWLQLKQVDLKWKPVDLLRGLLTVDSVRVRGGALIRLPAANKKQGDFSLPDLSVALALARLEGDLAFDGRQYDIRATDLRLSSTILQGEMEVRTSAGSDHLRLAGQWTGLDGPFSFEASLSAGEDGLIRAFIPLRYAGATEATLTGEGTFGQWAANLSFVAADQVQVQAHGSGENGLWTVQLQQGRNLLLDGVAGSLLGGEVEVNLTMTPLADQPWPFQIRVQATDLSAAVDGRLKATDGLAVLGSRFDGRIAQVVAGNGQASNLVAEGALQYVKGAFEASYVLKAGAASFEDVKAKNLSANGSVHGAGETWRGQLTALAGQLGWRGFEEEIGDGAADWTFDSRSGRWTVELAGLRTTSENRLSANVEGDNSGVETASVALNATPAMLARWVQIKPGGGRLDAGFSLTRRSNGYYDLEGEAKGTEMGFADSYTSRLFGTAPTISFRARVAANGNTEISDAALKGQGIVASTEGQLSSAALALSYKAVISALPKQLTSAVAMNGDVTVKGTIQGAPDMPRIYLSTGLDELAGYGIALRKVGFEMALTRSNDDADSWRGNGSLHGRSTMGTASAGIDLSVASDGRANLDARLQHPGLAGAVALKRTQTGDIQSSLEAMALPGEYAGLRVAGKASLTAQFRATGDAADADIQINGRDILVAIDGRLPFEAGAVEAHMQIPFAGTMVRPLLKAEVTDIRNGQYQVNSLSVSADDESLDRFHLEGVGRAVHPFSLAFDISSAPGRMKVTGSAEYGGYQIGILEAAILEFGKTTTFAAPKIAVNEGTVSLAMQLSANTLTTDVTLENLDLGLVNLVRPGVLQEGTATGQLNAGWWRGRTESLQASLELRDLLFLPAGFVTLQENTRYAAHVTLQTKASTLEMNGAFSDPGGTIGNIMGMLPYRFDVDGRSFELRENAPLTAAVTWTGDVDPLWRMVGRGDHFLDGEVTGLLKVEGTLNEPVFSGGLELSGGRYEYLPLGLVASIDELSIIGSGDQVQLVSLRASDFDNGRLSAQGAFELTSRLSFPGSLSLKMEDFHVARLDMLRGKVSADLTYTRRTDGGLLAGQVVTGKLNAFLPKELPVEVVDMEVIEVNGTAPVGGPLSRTRQREKPTALDISIKVPDRLFVEGRGLYSEWQGDLTLGGITTDPRLSGRINLRNGFLNFGSKKIDLEQGTLNFRARRGFDPDLSLQARYTARTIDATMNLSGTLSVPILKFQSVPEMPEDEIMSRILLGRSVSELSALQLAELAAAANTLRGGKGADIIGGIRRKLGLDTLSIERADDGGEGKTLVSGGKYLRENIFLELETAPASNEAAARLQVDITKNIALGTEVGLQQTSRVRLKWFWEY